MYFGKSEQIIKQREQIKIATLKKRKQIYFKEKFLNLETEILSNNQYTLFWRHTLSHELIFIFQVGDLKIVPCF